MSIVNSAVLCNKTLVFSTNPNRISSAPTGILFESALPFWKGWPKSRVWPSGQLQNRSWSLNPDTVQGSVPVLASPPDVTYRAPDPETTRTSDAHAHADANVQDQSTRSGRLRRTHYIATPKQATALSGTTETETPSRRTSDLHIRTEITWSLLIPLTYLSMYNSLS